MSSELKPCPFCGGDEIRLDRNEAGRYHAVCTTCECSFAYDWTKQEAITAWNQRAERTCEVEFYDDGWDALAEIEYADPHWELSCGHSTYGVTKPCYCSECGARVVE